MRLFRSEEEIPSDGGVTVPIDQLQRLARRWYGDRLDPDWRPRSSEESQRILDGVGLTEDFWSLG